VPELPDLDVPASATTRCQLSIMSAASPDQGFIFARYGRTGHSDAPTSSGPPALINFRYGIGAPWLGFCRRFRRPSNRISSYRLGVFCLGTPEFSFSASSTRRILISEEIGVTRDFRTARKQSVRRTTNLCGL